MSGTDDDTIRELYAENERLKAVLNRIKNQDTGDMLTGISNPMYLMGFNHASEFYSKLATHALS